MDKPALVDPPCLEPENKAPNVDISSTHGLEKKPRMRGVLHSYAAAAVAGAGLLMVLEAPHARAALAAAVFVVAAVGQFAISAIYHCNSWPPGKHAVLMRLDHSAIYGLIAATYTPFFMLSLGSTPFAGRVLTRIWLAALGGVGKTLLWPRAPRAISAGVYVALGWAAAPYMRLLVAAAGARVAVLIAVGGVLYSIGALVYASRWPDPCPSIFGFHEVFHALVVAAAACHFAGTYSVVKAAARTVGGAALACGLGGGNAAAGAAAAAAAACV